ncbi:type II toxin-antitoxin system Phd/YefM family antitoxin [Nocardia lasii]|uniref:Antitoxin n=1 Tax=Nocardia lasii TaxID=1616107 RepID=A0ABW1K205_9NOCA
MGTFGLRELRQQASELVRMAENGEDVTITVAGRPSVRLVPVSPAQWRRYDDIAELWSGPADPDWDSDRDLLDQQLRDPWTR